MLNAQQPPKFWYKNSLDRVWNPWYGPIERLNKTISELKQSGATGDYTIRSNDEHQRSSSVLRTANPISDNVPVLHSH